MKKRPAKRLQTCPHCKIGGFVNLKAHVCKKAPAKEVALEVVQPPAESLKAIETKLTPIASRIRVKTEDLLYDLVEAGLYLMQAREVHRVCNVAHSADGKLAGHGDDEGFQGWLEKTYPDISRRSAYNYINGAINCGLTTKDDSTAIEKLRAKHALKGKTAGELYALKDKEEVVEEEEKKRPKWQLMREAAVNLRERCEEIEALKEGMNKKVFQTVCARLHRTLETITESEWDIVEKKQHANFKEHGDVYEIGS